jgi:hypothetical protein
MPAATFSPSALYAFYQFSRGHSFNRPSHRVLQGLLLLVTAILFCSTTNAQTIFNHKYRLRVNADHSVTIEVKGIPQQTLYPRFTVMISAKDPGFGRNHQNYYVAPRTAVRWTNYEQDLATLNDWLAQPQTIQMTGVKGAVTTNAKGERTWRYLDNKGQETYRVSGAYASGTTDPFLAGRPIEIEAVSATVKGNNLYWQFPVTSDFFFTASLTLPGDSGDIQIDHQLTANTDAYYSVAFTGAPSLAAKEWINIPQEASGRQFKQFNHLVTEAYLRLPRVQLSTAGWNAALVMDAKEMPFRIPVNETSRFGMMLQLKDGQYKPVSLAPIMGGQESRLKKGQSHSCTIHYALQTGNWKTMYTYIARQFYGFRDMRDNSGAGSINNTLEHTIDYLVNRNGKNFAMWHDEQKYYDYWTDNSGIFKPFSPLYALSAAIVTDDEEMYRTRALPEVEFALSRDNNTFAPYEVAQNGQVKKRNRGLGESYIGAAQLTSLYHLFQDRIPAIAAMAEKKSFARNNFADMLALYTMTSNTTDLQAAESAAAPVLRKNTPSGTEEEYMNLLDLYEATHQKKYLDAAIESAYSLTTGINLSPAIPDTMLTVDIGNKVPIHEHSFGRHRLWGFLTPTPFPYKQQTVPAWRVALTGLTSPAYRGEYWMNNHGQLMRLAALGKDDFLRDIARWGMIGRFGNYPGDNRSVYSLIAEDSAAVEHPVWQLSFATINPGHVSEFTGELIDFMVSDAFERSAGKIDFPARSMQGTSFRVRVYGDRPGDFYNEKNVRLWLPRKLLSSNNRQVDYIAGYGNGKFYLACLNQSFQTEEVSITLNPERVRIGNKAEIKTWENNQPGVTVKANGNQLKFSIPPKGIKAFAISDAEVITTLQHKMFDAKTPVLSDKSFTSFPASFGNVHAMLISLGRGLTNAFVYTDALPENIISTKLRYRNAGGEWKEKPDAIFPYEFSIPFEEETASMEFEFEVETVAGRIEKSKTFTLSTGASTNK